jgi:hypothetical protein
MNKTYKEYYQAHRKEQIEKSRKYRKLHKKEINEKKHEYYEKNKKEQIEKSKKYRDIHKEEISRKKHEYYEKNKKTIKSRMQEWRKTHKKEIAISTKNNTNRKLKTDINFKLAHYLRNRLRIAIKHSQKSGSAVRDLGCSIPEFKLYLESKFQDGMSWKNYGFKGWHIDHIIPLVSFNLQNREEFLKANHYTNLQPMWAGENLEKGKRVK